MVIAASGTDLVIVAVGISAVIGAGYSMHRALKSVRSWAKRMIDIAGHVFSEAVDSSATGHLVKYHLGPNGTTQPLHLRVTETHDTELKHHRQNAVLLADIAARLVAVEHAQQTAASTAVSVAEDVEAERALRDDG